jgi:hypothetical protein
MTTTYRAEFFTAADYAKRDFEADSPQEALQLARQFYDDNLIALDFRSYDDIEPLDQVQIYDPNHGILATWESPDSILHRAAPDLLAALQQALAALNTVPRFKVPGLHTDSYKIAALCDQAIARTKGTANGDLQPASPACEPAS